MKRRVYVSTEKKFQTSLQARHLYFTKAFPSFLALRHLGVVFALWN